jgi:arsenite transporter
MEDSQEDEESHLGAFEKYLTLWVALSMSLGILIGFYFREAMLVFSTEVEYSSVNFVIAVLIWLMVYPMMTNVDMNLIYNIGTRPKGLVITVIVNWLIKPFTMAGLGILFFHVIYRDSLHIISIENADQYIAGMILLGAAPCTAMVFVWSQLVHGNATYTLIQVALNDFILIFLYAPIVAVLLKVTDLVVPWETLLLSVVLYLIIPLVAGCVTRWTIMRKHRNGPQLSTHDNITVLYDGASSTDEEGKAAVAQFTQALKPLSIVGLLITVVLLFSFQGHIILKEPGLIGLIAIPLVIQSYGIYFLAYYITYLCKIEFNVAATCALISTSNFFELAVAVAISLYGLNSGAALATVVGVLVEVPIMLSLVSFSNNTKQWFSSFE